MPSRSPEDWLNQSGRQSHVEVIEVDEQQFLLKASAEGHVLERAFPADAKETRSLKVQSIADQIAAGLLAAGEHLQAGLLPFVPFGSLPFAPLTSYPSCLLCLLHSNLHHTSCASGIFKPDVQINCKRVKPVDCQLCKHVSTRVAAAVHQLLMN